VEKAHKIENVCLAGALLSLRVDGKEYRIDITRQSERLARATRRQRERFELSPTGYGIHWPDIDEDLSIDGLIGVKHVSLLAVTTRQKSAGARHRRPERTKVPADAISA
jgi:hypothetical protein